MKKYWSIAALCLAAAGCLHAQVTVDILLDQEQFLRDEPLVVRVRVNNLSGQPITLGKEADWLALHVENKDGYSVVATGQIPAMEPYDLESAKAATRRIDLTSCYSLSRMGRYAVTARVKVKQWGQDFVSKPVVFEVVNGFKIWDQQFGVPSASGAPEVRKYLLEQANYLKRLMLYARITDAAETQTFRVIPIGPLVSFSRPEALLDKESNLHVLFQTGGWSFFYLVIDPQGTVKIRQRHSYTNTRPVLRAAESGKVQVVGGVRHIGEDDLPAPVSEDPTNVVKAPKP